MSAAAAPGEQNNQRATLLFVDDEQRVLTSMRAMFRRDYRVFTANSGAEALATMASEQVDVVISDQRMPEMTGVEVLSRVKAEYPKAMRILLTGYADLEAVEASINESEVFRYLMKPCPPEELRNAIALAVGALGAEPLAPRPQAELIPFPKGGAKATPRPVQTSEAPAPARPRAATERSPAPPRVGDAASVSGVEVLLLSKDSALLAAMKKAVGSGLKVRHASSQEVALAMLADHPVGVLVTDMAMADNDIEALTKALKVEVPELVTIVASERADATSLISLINDGQIYRFLLKPVARGQCRLWLESAARKYLELKSSPESRARHRVSGSSGGLMALLKGTMARIRSRLGGAG